MHICVSDNNRWHPAHAHVGTTFSTAPVRRKTVGFPSDFHRPFGPAAPGQPCRLPHALGQAPGTDAGLTYRKKGNLDTRRFLEAP